MTMCGILVSVVVLYVRTARCCSQWRRQDLKVRGGKSWGSGAKPPAGCRAPTSPLGGLEHGCTWKINCCTRNAFPLFLPFTFPSPPLPFPPLYK